MDVPEGAAIARVRAAAHYVRDRVRYVAHEVGIGSYQPRAATQVLAQLHGDCKDKATLLQALLAAGGDTAYLVPVHATQRDTVSNAVPSLTAFNHVITAVRLPAGTEVPEDVRSAVVETEDLGQLLFIDVTDEYTSIGALPDSLGGKTGLVVAGAASRLVTLPAGDRGMHRVEHRFEARVLDDLTVEGRMVTTRFGALAASARRQYAVGQQKFLEERKDAWFDEWPAASIAEHTIDAETAAGAFVESMNVRLAPPIEGDRFTSLALFPFALAELPRVSLSRRKTAVVYEHPLVVRFESVVRGVSEVNGPHPDRELEGQGWSARFHESRDDDAIRGSWELSLERRRFEPAEFDELKRFWAAARDTVSPALYLRPPEAAEPN
jgi:hypothetical protein